MTLKNEFSIATFNDHRFNCLKALYDCMNKFSSSNNFYRLGRLGFTTFYQFIKNINGFSKFWIKFSGYFRKCESYFFQISKIFFIRLISYFQIHSKTMFEFSNINVTYMIFMILGGLIVFIIFLKREIWELWNEMSDDTLKLFEIQEDLNNIRAELREVREENERRASSKTLWFEYSRRRSRIICFCLIHSKFIDCECDQHK